MIKLFKLTRNAWIAFFVALLAAFIMSFTAYAQTDDNPETIARKYGVTFPISELGGCGNYAQCRTYCEDPVNANACINFAKAKGFYKQEQEVQKQPQILTAAKNNLGCNSADSCQAMCSDSANYDKCSSFAQNQGITGGYVQKPDDSKVLNRAKQVLGCSSADSCKSFCEQAANRDKCSTFAKQTGLNGGQRQVGPGGCTSEETCRAFCSDPNNFTVCKGFTASAGRGNFSGPGGCNSEESCRTYCQSNPDQCRAIMMPTTTRGDDPHQKFCQQNPDKCREDRAGDTREFERYCLQNPERCRSQDNKMNPQEMCVRNPNCNWTNNTCQCGGSGINSSPQPSGYSGNNSGNYGGDNFEAAKQRCLSSGGTWTSNNYCQMPNNGGPSGGSSSGGYYNGTYEDPATACRRGGGCTWTGSTCQCPTGTNNNSTANTQTGSSITADPASECGKHAGCTWTGSTCNCVGQTQTQQQSQPQPQIQPQPAQTSPSTPPPSTPQPSPMVQGVAAIRSLLDQVLDFFRK